MPALIGVNMMASDVRLDEHRAMILPPPNGYEYLVLVIVLSVIISLFYR